MPLGQDKERATDGEPQDLAGGTTVLFCVEGRMVDPAQGGLPLDSRQVPAKGFLWSQQLQDSTCSQKRLSLGERRHRKQ